MFVPKSYRIRHKILELLRQKRSVQQLNKKDINESMLTIQEIADTLNLSYNDVDGQLNVLWKRGEVVDENTNAIPRFIIQAEGIASASSNKYLIEGKTINSELFNNYASGFFQIIIAITAISTLFFTISTDNSTNERLDKLEQKLENTLVPQTESSKGGLIQNNYADTILMNQTNSQTSDTLN